MLIKQNDSSDIDPLIQVDAPSCLNIHSEQLLNDYNYTSTFTCASNLHTPYSSDKHKAHSLAEYLAHSIFQYHLNKELKND